MNDFWKLIGRVKKYKKYFALSILSNILLSIFTVFSIPVIIPFFQLLFDRIPKNSEATGIIDNLTVYFQSLIYNQGRDRALIIVCGLILIVFLMKNIFRYLSLYFIVPMRTGIVRDIRTELYSKYMHMPYSFYQDQKTGDLISRITTDVQEIETSILKVIEIIFKSPLIIIGSILFMLFVSPKLSLFVLVLLVFTAIVIGGISRTLKRQSTEAQERIGDITSTIEESISGIKVIKAFGAEQSRSVHFSNQNNAYRNVMIKLLNRQNLSSPLSEFLGIAVVTALLWFGSRLVFQETLLPETFFAFIFAFYQVIEPAKSFSTAYYNIQKGMAAVERVDALMNRPVNPFSGNSKFSFKEKIKIQNLNFSYHPDDDTVLKDVNLEIHRGECIAIVGHSGSGKTTLIDLLLGFYPVPEGSILIDDRDISSFPNNELRSIFSLVSQHPVLFHDTIMNNVKFGSEGKSKEEVVQSTRVAFAHDFIEQLTDGYDTIIGDKGMKLSGGQRQRITIARAVLNNSDILILDEATSALDSESETQVQSALETVLKDRTSIVIAHRLSTIKKADKIVVMDEGKIIAVGKHQELYNSIPLFRKYVDIQGIQ